MIAINRNEIPTFLKSVFKEGLSNIYYNKYSYLGGFKNEFKNSKSNAASVKKRILFQFYKEGKINDFSKYNLDYFNKIIELCKKNHITLTLLNTPLQSSYKNQIPKIYIENYNEIIGQKKLKLIDFSELKLSDSCFIPDGDHVFEKGSEILSHFLANKR